MKLFLLIFSAITLLSAEIGQVTVVRGDASVERNLESLKVYTFMEILRQDIVKTKQGRMQIVFNDNTVISLGRDSKLVIEEYFYEAGSDRVSAKFKIEEGFIKTITGIIGKIMPEMFVLETAVTEIRPRGTIWSVRIEEDTEYYSVTEGKILLNFKGTQSREIELSAGESMSVMIDSSGREKVVASYQKNYLTQQKVESVIKAKTDVGYESRVEHESSSLREDKGINSNTIMNESGEIIGNSTNEHGNNPDARKRK